MDQGLKSQIRKYKASREKKKKQQQIFVILDYTKISWI